MHTRRLSLDGYRKITAAALVALAAIVVTGGAVRVTGSGLGCEDWPNCSQDRLVAPLEYHAQVEFINRLFTGAVSIAVVLAVLGSLVLVERRRDLTWLSLGLVAGVIGQIVLGGLVVLFDLNPWLVLGHFALSMVLVANALWLHERTRRPARRSPAPDADPAPRRLARGVVAAALAVLATGTIVTGSGPHSGAHGDQLVDRLDFTVHATARVHGIAMVVFLAVTTAYAYRFRAGPPARRRDITAVLVTLCIQAAIGYTQYFTGVPATLVALHLAGATAVWITVVRLYLHTEPITARAPAAVANVVARADT